MKAQVWHHHNDVCMCVFARPFLYVCVFVSMPLCVYMCVSVCTMYVCVLCVCMCVYVYTQLTKEVVGHYKHRYDALHLRVSL